MGEERGEKGRGNYSENLKDRLVIRLNIHTDMIFFLIVTHLKGHPLQNDTGQISVGCSTMNYSDEAYNYYQQ